jgi:hypothetical protein
MLRKRIVIAVLIALAILPLVGCRSPRCCYPPPAPVAAPPCP